MLPIKLKATFLLLAFTFLAGLMELQGQSVSINTDGDVPNPYSILDVKDTAKGLLIPRMSTTDRTDLGSNMGNSEEGMTVYDTISDSYWLWDGAAWRQFDMDSTNEFNKSLSLSGNTLSISDNGGTLTQDLSGINPDGYGANFQSVAPTSDISISSNSWQDMGGMSITFTPQHSTVFVQVSCAGSYSGTSSAANLARVRIVRDGTSIAASGFSVGIIDTDQFGTVETTNGWSTSFLYPVPVTAGNSTTIKVQWKYDSAGGGARDLNNLPSSDPSAQHRAMTIID